MSILLDNMLSRVPDDLDKREGSIIYDALAPAAFELSQVYAELARCFEQSFVVTATGENLDLRVGELGLSRNDPVKAVRRATFCAAGDVPLAIAPGTRFSTLDGENAQNFTVITEIAVGAYDLEAEEGGVAGNDYQGALLPIDHVDGLAAATMSGEPIIDGADAESDDELRARYLSYVYGEPGNGNVAQYAHWASSYSGVGRAKVFPAWDGPHTVKVSILDSEQEPASATLIAAFQEYLDPDGSGLGGGMAPVGAIVTVSTATAVTVDVTATVSVAAGYSTEQATAAAQAAIEACFMAAAYQKTAISAIEIGAALLTLPAIESVTTLALNGAATVSLGSEEIPQCGTLTLEVSA